MSKHPTISKTNYMQYLECPLYGWLAKNERELMEDDGENLIMYMGQETEKLSHGLFDEGVEVKSYYEAGSKETKELMDKGATVIYQAQAMTPQFLARTDILVKKKDGWHLYEVKSSTEVKDKYLNDIGFQTNAFKLAGVEIQSVSLIHVNNQYVYDAKKGIEPDKLFTIVDLTDEVMQGLGEELKEMKKAHKILTGSSRPVIKSPKKSFEYDLPPLLHKEYYKGIPEYSIYDLKGSLPQEKVDELMAKGIVLMKDIPADYDLTDAQWEQVKMTREKGSQIDKQLIKEDLEQLVFPLYFLDYETLCIAIPPYDGVRPWQQVPMQYSLHVLDKLGGKLKHFEYLHESKESPFEPIAKRLSEQIGKKGTVIAWNASFEKGRNTDIGKKVPKYKDFMADVNARMYDPLLTFRKAYDDYRFKGSFSLKSVLPTLLPEHSYKDLDVQGGGDAMEVIYNLVFGHVANKEALKKQVLDYCARDTLVMVKLYEFLLEQSKKIDV